MPLIRRWPIGTKMMPMPVLRIAALFGDLADRAPFVAAVGKQLAAIYARGMKEALRDAASDQDF